MKKLYFVMLSVFLITGIAKSQTTIELQISGSTDDAEEYIYTPDNDSYRTQGSMDITSSDIELATNDFTANGGDGYPFTSYTYTSLGTTYQQAFKNYLVDADGLNGVIPESVYPYNGPKTRMIAEIYQSPAIQSILLSQHFNNCETGLPSDWLAYSVCSNHDWKCTSRGASGEIGDYAVEMNGYGADEASEDWLISPRLSLDADKEYFLNFSSMLRYSGPKPVVLYSTAFSGVGNPNDAIWNEISEASNAISTSFSMSPEIDLSFIDEDAYIAFKYVSEGSSGGQSRIFLLDEVKISEPAEIINNDDVMISEIQGTTDESPLVKNIVTTRGIVTASFYGVEPYTGAGYNGNIRGFYMQDPIGDGDDNTSEGIYVYTNDNVAVGDSVIVTGTVTEYYGLTEINKVSSLKIVSSGNLVPEPVEITLPLENPEDFEKYESMLVEFTDELTVTENRNIENYGEVRLSSGGILYQPTQVVDPNDVDPDGLTANGNSNVGAVLDYMDLNKANNFLLDDTRTYSNPSPIPYVDTTGNLIAGSTVNGVTGILSYGHNNYRVYPVEAPVFSYATREELPEFEEASLKVASFNVLNYFNGDGQGGGFPTSRGAKTYNDFVKQTQKIVAALKAIDGDVVGLMEIENDDNNGYSAIKNLVDALNTELGETVYDFVSTGIITSATATVDEIKVGLIYKTTTVGLVGDYAILNNDFDPEFHDDYNRPALAQTFIDLATGTKFTTIVNHLKSKGSGCDDLGDPNDSDGQGNCNVTRTKAAGTLASWLETDPTGSESDNFIILGDLNSYLQEDPIDTLRSRGYENVIPQDEYSYVYGGQFGTLDYAIVNASMKESVTEAVIWHINSVEPDMYAYNGQDEKFNADPYRASDHDPVIVGLKFIPNLRIREFTLVDAKTNMDIRSLVNNDTINYKEIGTKRINFKAEVDSIAQQVFIMLNGRHWYWYWNIDITEPYTLFPERRGHCTGRYLRPGDYTLTAYPYRDCWFDTGEPLSINFTVKGNRRYYHHREWYKSAEEDQMLTQTNEPLIYPVPFSSEINVSIKNAQQGKITVRLYNNVGTLVFIKQYELFEGENIISCNVENLKSGAYFIKIDELGFSKTIIKNR